MSSKSRKSGANIALNKIRGIIFDLDNTLYLYEPAHRAGIVASHKKYPIKQSLAKFTEKYNVARDKNESELFGTGSSHNRLLYFQKMLETDNCFSPNTALELARAYWIAFITGMKLEPQLRETLLLLVRKYKLGILSDLTADIQFAKLTAHRLWPFFDAIVTSEEVGVEKPSKIGIKLLLKKMNLRANQVIIVGDNPMNDGLCAKKLGIPFIQIIRSDIKQKIPGVVAWRKIKKLPELQKVLLLKRTK